MKITWLLEDDEWLGWPEGQSASTTEPTYLVKYVPADEVYAGWRWTDDRMSRECITHDHKSAENAMAEVAARHELESDMRGSCEVCGERYDCLDSRPSVADIGEFVDADGKHVIAHAECGINAGLQLA